MTTAFLASPGNGFNPVAIAYNLIVSWNEADEKHTQILQVKLLIPPYAEVAA